jgi:hypothetical protein
MKRLFRVATVVTLGFCLLFSMRAISPAAEIEWKTLTSKEGRFSADFPVAVPAETKAGPKRKSIWSNHNFSQEITNGAGMKITYTIWYIDFEGTTANEFMRLIADQEYGGKAPEKSISLGKFPGLEWQKSEDRPHNIVAPNGVRLEITDTFVRTLRVFVVKNRAYILDVEDEANLPSLTARFLNSFQILD